MNDLITSGARPLFFLDYFASGKFQTNVIGEVLKGVTEGCQQSGCALVGGETAIMPGFYTDKKTALAAQYDMAGFSVGAVDRKKVVTGKKIRTGDIILGIQSSGFHSNGYSLLRKIFSEKELSGPLGRKLLTPTFIYVKPVLALVKKIPVRGIVNITGGGFYDNLPRVIPKGLGARIARNSWKVPEIFRIAQKAGGISDHEMYKTFNMGVGMVVILEKRYISSAQKVLKSFRLNSWAIGEIVRSSGVTIS